MTPSTPPPPTQSDGKNGGPNTVALALGSLGGVLALAVVAALVFFYFQRKRKRENAYSEGPYPQRGMRSSRRMSLDLEEPRPIDNTRDHQTVSRITPFSGPQAPSNPDYLRYSRDDSQHAVPVPFHSGTLSSSGPSKASQAGLLRQPRYIVHTDVEDAVPEDDDQDVIELPPTYSERGGTSGPPSTAGP